MRLRLVRIVWFACHSTLLTRNMNADVSMVWRSLASRPWYHACRPRARHRCHRHSIAPVWHTWSNPRAHRILSSALVGGGCGCRKPPAGASTFGEPCVSTGMMTAATHALPGQVAHRCVSSRPPTSWSSFSCDRSRLCATCHRTATTGTNTSKHRLAPPKTTPPRTRPAEPMP
jgi:hypothetical protein